MSAMYLNVTVFSPFNAMFLNKHLVHQQILANETDLAGNSLILDTAETRQVQY